jgi:hypothetical protein
MYRAHSLSDTALVSRTAAGPNQARVNENSMLDTTAAFGNVGLASLKSYASVNSTYNIPCTTNPLAALKANFELQSGFSNLAWYPSAHLLYITLGKP